MQQLLGFLADFLPMVLQRLQFGKASTGRYGFAGCRENRYRKLLIGARKLEWSPS